MTKRNIKKGIFAFFALILLMISAFSGQNFLPAFADTVKHTTVLEDLQKDEDFDLAAYPDDTGDLGIYMIRIGESARRELFVYTYQPATKTQYLVASEIRFSTEQNGIQPKDYSLTLISAEHTLFKYKVNDFIVKADRSRLYDVIQIVRPWDKELDSVPDGENTATTVPIPVGIEFSAVTDENDEVHYAQEKIETIEVIEKYVSFVKYSNGFTFFPSSCNSHYVAFTTDKPIEQLMEADLTYTAMPYTRTINTNPTGGTSDRTNYGESHEETLTLKGSDRAEHMGSGFLAKKYTWERIQSVEEFKNGTDYTLTENELRNLENKEWVLRFAETEYSGFAQATTYVERGTYVQNVTILRLKFRTGLKLYNLGVVDNKQTGSGKPGNEFDLDLETNFFTWLANLTGIPEWFWIALAVIIPLLILLPVLSIFFPIVGTILKAIFKGLWWLICLPFRGIAALVRWIKEKRESR